jgi:branched-chain amino acid transport system permease protein
VIAVEIIVFGVILGGMYAMVALGLTLQYGVARIMNLAYGEFLIAGAFGAYWLYTAHAVNPLVGLIFVVPVAFAVNWAVYRFLLMPLVRRAKSREALEADSILFTFGLLFVLQGIGTAIFGGQFYSYAYLAVPVDILDVTVSANRLVAAVFALAIGIGLYFALTRTRTGTAIRAVAVDPAAANCACWTMRSSACSRLSAKSFVYSWISPPTIMRRFATMSRPIKRERTTLPRTSPNCCDTVRPFTSNVVDKIIAEPLRRH